MGDFKIPVRIACFLPETIILAKDRLAYDFYLILENTLFMSLFF